MVRSFSFSLRALAGLAAVSAFAAVASADILYVDQTATGANNGTSWKDAYSGTGGLTAAITASVSGDQIWVAGGRYIPGAARAASFTLKNGVAIYGGFAGTEDLLSERDLEIEANASILSGDVSNNDTAYPSTVGWTENNYHVVTGTGRNATAILDGFRLTHGYANSGTSDQDKGGGIICLSGNATFRNLHVINNRVTFGGGGLYLRTASPTLTDCDFEANNGASFGGACDMATTCNPIWERCVIVNNTAARAGGVECFGSSQPDFINCIFVQNVCTGSGGGGALWVGNSSNVDVINCTIYANSSTAIGGGGILTTGANTRVRSSIVYLNTGPGGATAGNQLTGSAYNAQYNCVQGGFTGAGNISTNPNLVDPLGAYDFAPQPGSPVIDAGINSAYSSPNLLDFATNPRMVDDPDTVDTGLGTPPVIDIGALEFQPALPDCPEILDDPSGGTYCAGLDLVLAVGAAGDIDGLQWQLDGVDIPGETTAVLGLKNITNDDEGAYTVVITSAGCKTLETQAAVVIVCLTDIDCNGVVNSSDVGEFVNLYFADQANGTLLADFDHNGVSNSADVGEMINAWFVETGPNGCVG